MLGAMATLRDSTGTLYADELEIRLGEGLVLATGRALTLSVREFELLVAMARRIGAVITREELYESVWGGELRTGDRSVDVYVSKLRGKLEAAVPDRSFIHTHPGFGYRFQPEPAPAVGPRQARTAATAASRPVGSRAGSRLSRNVHIGTARA
jgi:DNA-binding response OmpR family regulator